MNDCILFGNEFASYDNDACNKCAACGSYICFCNSLSSVLNKDFHENVYANTKSYSIDNTKKFTFYFFKSIDKKIRKREYKEFDTKHLAVLQLLNDKTKKILEVGFGTGCDLRSLLESGADAYGIDISQANVDRFIEKYPEFSGRVSCSTRFDRPVDIVYSFALFEHLDDPQEFLGDVGSVITDGGYVLLDNIPVMNKAISNISIHSDINFREGIHKAIYTKEAIIQFFENNDYCLCSYGGFDYFICRVLSAHKIFGHDVIKNIRHPYMSGDGLPGLPGHVRSCKRAVTVTSHALSGFAVFVKNTPGCRSETTP